MHKGVKSSRRGLDAILIFGTMAKTALIIGATGLVGEQCLNELLNSVAYEKVIALTRKPIKSPKAKLQCLVTDFENLDSLKDQLKADDIFCAIGTTIAKAGSKEAFRKVDFEIPLKVAEIAKQNGATRFILVSSLGADAKSSVFYSKVKGELEEAVKKLRYDWLVIFRPSILLGDRKEKRTGEQIGRFVAEKFSFLFAGPLRKYAGTPVYLLSKKMVRVAQEKEPSSLEKIPLTRIIDNEEILR
jgi:uncharacterized protein YbjT (DUF2867 family)